jgi:glutathione synthase/RimK-type ligase-like ATP-grasp enzyme
VIIQKYIEIKEEFRGIVLGGKCLGLVKKIPSDNKIARNAAQGARFISTSDIEISAFIEANANKNGLVGVDVARDTFGKIYYIESNRSPQWKYFEKATGINVTRALIKYAYLRASI